MVELPVENEVLERPDLVRRHRTLPVRFRRVKGRPDLRQAAEGVGAMDDQVDAELAHCTFKRLPARSFAAVKRPGDVIPAGVRLTKPGHKNARLGSGEMAGVRRPRYKRNQPGDNVGGEWATGLVPFDE